MPPPSSPTFLRAPASLPRIPPCPRLPTPRSLTPPSRQLARCNHDLLSVEKGGRGEAGGNIVRRAVFACSVRTGGGTGGLAGRGDPRVLKGCVLAVPRALVRTGWPPWWCPGPRPPSQYLHAPPSPSHILSNSHTQSRCTSPGYRWVNPMRPDGFFPAVMAPGPSFNSGIYLFSSLSMRSSRGMLFHKETLDRISFRVPLEISACLGTVMLCSP